MSVSPVACRLYEVVGEPGPVLVPDGRLHRGDALEVGSLGGSADGDAVHGVATAQALHDVSALRDHDRFPLLRHEAGRDQPFDQISRLVVPPRLPLDRLALGGEVVPLASDQRVQLSPVDPLERAIADEPAPWVLHPDQRSIGTRRHVRGFTPATELVVVRREQDSYLVNTRSFSHQRTVPRAGGDRLPAAPVLRGG